MTEFVSSIYTGAVELFSVRLLYRMWLSILSCHSLVKVNSFNHLFHAVLKKVKPGTWYSAA